GGTRVVHLTGLSVAEEFLAWEPGARFAFTGTGASRGVLRSLVENIVLARAGDSATDVSYTMAVDPVGGRPVAVVLRQVFSQTIKRGLDGLAAVAES
ncbi:SRPBCC family protein, partial [Algoriphagus aestuarii]|nr:SRPBCC family protein [Algoriphagus aestuarii]